MQLTKIAERIDPSYELDFYIRRCFAEAEEFLEDFEWKSLISEETDNARFMISMERMDNKTDTFENYRDLSSESPGLLDLITRLDNSRINGLYCFRWIIDNFDQSITYIQNLPPLPNLRKITDDWRPSKK